MSTRTDATLTVVVIVLIAAGIAGGFFLGRAYERDLPAGSYDIVPSTVATTPVDRPERPAVCRCAGRGDR